MYHPRIAHFLTRVYWFLLVYGYNFQSIKTIQYIAFKLSSKCSFKIKKKRSWDKMYSILLEILSLFCRCKIYFSTIFPETSIHEVPIKLCFRWCIKGCGFFKWLKNKSRKLRFVFSLFSTNKLLLASLFRVCVYFRSSENVNT